MFAPLIKICKPQLRMVIFREDLYYRLYVIPIIMPSLSKRGNDVLEIAKKLIKKYAFEEKKHFIVFLEM